MSITLPIVEARNKLTTLPEQFEQEPDMDAVIVTRRGRPVLAILPWELYDALTETLEIIGNRKLMEALEQSMKEIDDGDTVDLEDVVARLRL